MSDNLIELDSIRLQKLPPGELAPYLMRMPVRQRLEAILQRNDAEAVVAALPNQDFFFSVQEIGPDDSLPLLALGSHEQLNHLFGIEWWKKDRVEPARAVSWVDRLARASEEKLLEWLYHADFELLVILFKNWINVAVMPEDVDPVEAREQLPVNTLDDVYFWEARYPQYEDLLKRVLQLIFQVNYGFYKELFNHVIWGLEFEIEEDAYRFNRARLEEDGIPDFYDALNIYRAVDHDELIQDKSAIVQVTPESPPAFAIALIPEGDLLETALNEIQDTLLLDGLKMELASLANKVLIADGLSPDSPQSLRFAVDKAVAYVNLGLDVRTSGSVPAAQQALKSIFLEVLFRIGQAEVAKIRNRMTGIQQRGWIQKWPRGLRCLDGEWLEAADALLQKTPMLSTPLPGQAGIRTENLFRTRRDLDLAMKQINVIEALRIPFDALAADAESLRNRLLPEGQISTLDDVTIGAMIWTAAAWAAAEGAWTVKPIPVGLWPSIFPMLQGDAIAQLLERWLLEIAPNESERTLVEMYVQPLISHYREETAPFGTTSPPDPQTVKFFLFSRD